jgi:hypothetical protein
MNFLLNHGGTMILLKLLRLVFAKITVTQCDSAKLTNNPNVH